MDLTEYGIEVGVKATLQKKKEDILRNFPAANNFFSS